MSTFNKLQFLLKYGSFDYLKDGQNRKFSFFNYERIKNWRGFI